MTRRDWLFGLLMCSCSVAAEERSAASGPQNECEQASECGSGACIQGRCVAHSGRFSTVLVEVTPPAGLGDVAGVSFIKRLDDMALPSNGRDLDLGHVARIDGHVIATPSEHQIVSGCEYAFAATDGTTATLGVDGSLPARVVFIPTELLLGLSVTSYSVEMPVRFAEQHAFSLRVPPGSYNIHVQPAAQAQGSCGVPPQVFTNQTIGTGDVKLSLTLAPPQRFVLRVRPSTCGAGPCALAGWVADMIDPVSGRLVSTKTPLREEDMTLVDGVPEYAVELNYWPLSGDVNAAANELVRLAPPAALTAPTLLTVRSALELFSKGEGLLLLPPLPSPVTVEGEVTVKGTAEPVRASIALVATSIQNIQTGTASFVRRLETDASGRFQVELLPGNYAVHATPQASAPLSTIETAWVISSDWDRHAGKLIELPGSIALRGTVLDSTRRQFLNGTAVFGVPSPWANRVNVLDQALGELPSMARASAALTDGGGGFVLSLDPGTYDLSIQPSSDTGFAWLVRPNVAVAQSKDLGSLSLPLPVVHRGRVTAPSVGAVRGALLRAYIYMDQTPAYTSDPSAARSVLAIAETRANDEGRYELLLPAELESQLP